MVFTVAGVDRRTKKYLVHHHFVVQITQGWRNHFSDKSCLVSGGGNAALFGELQSACALLLQFDGAGVGADFLVLHEVADDQPQKGQRCERSLQEAADIGGIQMDEVVLTHNSRQIG